MRDEDEEDPKTPYEIAIGRKGDNAAESEEHGPDEVGPDSGNRRSRYHHMHVRC